MASNLKPWRDSCLPWSTIVASYGVMRTVFRRDQRDSSPFTEEVTALSASDCCREEARKEEMEMGLCGGESR